MWLALAIAVPSCRFDLPRALEADAGGPPPLSLELLAGDIGGSGNLDETGIAARFSKPSGVAVDGDGNVYVADTENHTIRKITATGVVTTLAGSAGSPGSVDGTGTSARFAFPLGVAVDSDDNVYVADASNHTIRKITAAGVVTTLAGAAGSLGSADGAGLEARFHSPSGVAVDSAGNVHVADESNHVIRKITATGVVTTLAGVAGVSGSADGTGSAARFSRPHNLAVDGAGNVYVADMNSHTIRKVTTTGVVTTLAGTAGAPGSADGTGAAARFNSPSGVAVDRTDNIYVADAGNRTIRKITVNGVVTTRASSAGPFPLSSVAIDRGDNIYVADAGNHTIGKVIATGIVMTWAGAASRAGSADGSGTAARFYVPSGVAVDSTGNVYVADSGNCTIRKITPAGVVTTLAGSARSCGTVDGTGAEARFDFPYGLALDGAGNLYVTDIFSCTIRKVTPTGGVTTLAGSADLTGSADGTSGEARFDSPYGMAVDGAGNVYVADVKNHIIRRVTATGVVTTLAGTAGAPGSTDGTGTAARFNNPSGVALDGAGNVYVADRNNHVIRKITTEGTITTIAGMAELEGIHLGETPRFALPSNLTISGDSIVISDANAVLLLHHGAQ
jgi:sugar lactone lactonase YvrE